MNISVFISDDEIDSLNYAIGNLRYSAKIEKNDVFKSDILKVVSDLISIRDKYMESLFKEYDGKKRRE